MKNDFAMKFFAFKLRQSLFSNLILAIPLICICLQILTRADGYLNSDTSSFIILAHESLKQSSLFPNTFYYGNGDFLLGPNIPAALIIFLGGSDHLALVLALEFFAVVTWLSFYFLAKQMTVRKFPIFVALTTLFCCLSDQSNFFLFFQSSYSLVVISSFLALAWYIRIVRFTDWSIRDLTFLFVSQIPLLLQNPIREVVWILVPLSITEIYRFFSSVAVNKKKIKNWFKILSIGSLIFGVTFIFRLYLQSRLNTSYGILGAGYLIPNEALTHLGNVFTGFMSYMDFMPAHTASLLSLNGLTSTAHIFFFLLFSFTVVRAFKFADLRLKLALLFCIVSFTITLDQLLFTGLYADSGSFRYLLPSCLPAFTIAVFWIFRESLRINTTFKILVICSVGLLASAQTCLNVKNPPIRANSFTPLKSSLARDTSIPVLASFWNANLLQVDSNEKIEARPIILSKTDCITPYKWLTIKSNEFIPNSFWMLLSKEEFIDFNGSASCKKFNSRASIIKLTPDQVLIKVGP